MLAEDIRLLGQRPRTLLLAAPQVAWPDVGFCPFPMLLSPMEVTQVCLDGCHIRIGFALQSRNTELREFTTFTVRSSEVFLCLGADVVSSLKVAHSKCSLEKWLR